MNATMKTTGTIVILTTLLCLTPIANTAHRTITTASPSLRAMTQSPFVWQTATPESQGMSKAKLDALKDVLAARKTKAFLVIRNDRIVYEWYAAEHGPEKKHTTASLAKALVGGLSLAVALTDGRIALDDKAAKFIPPWKSDAQKSRITIRQLGSHTSGLADAEADRLPHEQLTGWQGDFWKRLAPLKRSVHDCARQNTGAFCSRREAAIQQSRQRAADLLL